jgi:MOSC domain-containing protein YiiM
LHRDLPAGIFGENITFSSFGTSSLRIGDRFRIKDVLLEVSFARIPCKTLAARMGDPGFVKRFAQARRPGVYARLIKTGEIQVGDRFQLIQNRADHPTVIELFDLWMSKERHPDLIKKGLEAPISERSRSTFQSWLAGES